MEINIEKMAIKITEKVLDDLLYKGKTLREWINLIIKFEKENKTTENKYNKYNKYNCDTCAKKCESELLNLSELTKSTGCLGWKQKEDTRFICDSCRKKLGCPYYGYVKSFIEENSNNDMKCECYIKE